MATGLIAPGRLLGQEHATRTNRSRTQQPSPGEGDAARAAQLRALGIRVVRHHNSFELSLPSGMQRILAAAYPTFRLVSASDYMEGVRERTIAAVDSGIAPFVAIGDLNGDRRSDLVVVGRIGTGHAAAVRPPISAQMQWTPGTLRRERALAEKGADRIVAVALLSATAGGWTATTIDSRVYQSGEMNGWHATIGAVSGLLGTSRVKVANRPGVVVTAEPGNDEAAVRRFVYRAGRWVAVHEDWGDKY